MTVPTSSLRIRQGTCLVLLAYDVGAAIDLAACERRLADTQRQTLRVRRRAVEYFEYRPAPVRASLEVARVVVGGRPSSGQVDVVLYDFGAVSVTWAFSLAGSVVEAVALSEAVGGTSELRSRSRTLVEDLVQRLRGAVRDPRVAPIVEDYRVFHLEALEPPVAPGALWTTHAQDIGRLLRSEPGVLSEQEVSDAVAARLAYGPDDVTFVDWDGAVVYALEIDDIRTVIDFANVQLLEMRFLDRELDAALDQSYALVSRRGRWRDALHGYQSDLRRIAQMQVDAAMLFERVSSALKVFGDQYLARAYRQLAERFRLAEWDAAILRKLQTLNSIYGKLSDQTAAWRLELLEWIIVVLIAAEILLPAFR